MRARSLALVPLFAALLGTSAAAPTQAEGLSLGRLRTNYKSGEIITAFSRYGNGSIRSVVRRGQNGWQVKLPSGNWTYCRRSCEETLRVQTIDFYEGGNSIDDGGYGSLARECGVFGCLGGSYTFSF
ncbi:hypothetical protein [Hyphomicrobium sp.]|uniref:hypothetical protein n=1 Tax=Hyphomicrobium sp. TaxID=82 RepID=UPI000F923488|nr:hypothetical protein [Hyphomicrobium sp.]RUO99467.1 MAG: hypothetical protein EKK30_06110 [Hyphomicrobium sp.]